MDGASCFSPRGLNNGLGDGMLRGVCMAEYTVKHTGSNTAEIAFSWPQSCEAGQHLHALTKVAAAKKYGNSGGGDNDDGEKRDSALFCPYSAEKTNSYL